MGDIRFSVKRYLDEGRHVLPVKTGEKATRFPDWPNATPALDDFAESDNVAERLDDLVDVDCDCKETRTAAARMLLDTERKHGRPSAGTTHYFYTAAEGTPKPEVFKDTEGHVLVEIRTGNQQYTLIPPSVLPRKDDPNQTETLEGKDGQPGRVMFEGLRESVAALATAALLAKNWPSGSRHDCAMMVAGFLISRELEPDVIALIVKTAAELAGDGEIDDRLTAVRSSIATFQKGGKTTGLPRLGAIIGDDVVKRLRAWWGGEGESVVDEMNAKHFVVDVGSTTAIGTEHDGGLVVFQRERDLALRYSGDRVQIGSKAVKGGATAPVYKTKYEVWKDSTRRRNYRTVVFKPNPRPCDERDYNLWKGFTVEPKAGDCSLFLKHLRDGICSGVDEHYKYLLDLMAFTVQEPGNPSEIAAVFRGQQGTGKGFFVRTFGRLFGRHYIQVDKREHITGKFNAQLSAKVLVFADEAIWAGDKRDIGPLKRLISEPTLTIERKGIDTVSEDNCIHLFMATNEGWAAPVGFNERRFFILDVSVEHMQQRGHFRKIDEQMSNGGLEALLDALLKRKFDRDALAHAPKTAALRDQQDKSLPAEMRWWKESLLNGELAFGVDEWPEWISVAALHWSYLKFCDRVKAHGSRLSVSALIDLVCAMVPKFESGRKYAYPLDDRGNPLPASKIQTRGYFLPKLDACRKMYDQQSGIVTPWPVIDVKPAKQEEDM
jgi:hypothetical protein